MISSYHDFLGAAISGAALWDPQKSLGEGARPGSAPDKRSSHSFLGWIPGLRVVKHPGKTNERPALSTLVSCGEEGKFGVSPLCPIV